MTAPVIFGCAGAALAPAERDFFREVAPWGFILFARNIDTPAQVRALVEDLRASVGREAPVLIDQEGGRVARLRPPHWRGWCPVGAVTDATLSEDERHEWLRVRYALIGAELRAAGIDVDCMPLLDLPVPGAHDIIGDRALGHDVASVIGRGRAVCAGLRDAGVLPVIKHIPGHGRACADSHEALPIVATDRETLEATDFAPFRAFADAELAMTAHVVFPALDAERCATLSPPILSSLRDNMGLAALLMSDDLSMKALSGTMEHRAAEALAAGCDVVLHCNGDAAEMADVARGLCAFTAGGRARAERALSLRDGMAANAPDTVALSARYAALSRQGGLGDG